MWSDDEDLLLDLGPGFRKQVRAPLSPDRGLGKGDSPVTLNNRTANPSREAKSAASKQLLDLTLDDDDVVPVAEPSNRYRSQNSPTDLYDASRSDPEPAHRPEARWAPPLASREPDMGDDDINLLPRKRQRGVPIVNDYEYAGMLDDTADEELAPAPARPRGRTQGGRLTEEEKAARAAERERQKEATAARKAQEKADKAQERARAKAQREADKAAEKAAKSQATHERRQATGSFKDREILVWVGNCVVTWPGGTNILSALNTRPFRELKEPYKYGVRTHSLAPFRSLQWQRARDGTPADATRPAEDFQDIPYVAVILTAEEAVREAENAFERLVHLSAQRLPGFTLSILMVGLEQHLRNRERSEYRTQGPSVLGFNKEPVEQAISALTVRYPGVRHCQLHDNEALGEHVLYLTRQLTEQPYAPQDAFLGNFGGKSKDTQTASQVLSKYPLEHPDQKVVFNALQHIPSLGATHAQPLAQEFKSLGNIMALLHDPYGSRNTTRAMREMSRAVIGTADRCIGPAAIERMEHILTCEDPDAAADPRNP
ncbi:hypothetical protein WJX73_009334 [Symbiochloris irregularis]|uniref:ERCC4 domain-containing protein n=1 Tax=Symbiochloris irregularis TaxID=706552 RepID=A0AAW1PRS7_9CHLO